MSDSIIQISDLQIGYKNHTPLNTHKFSMHFKSGELFCLLGANGTGKSTLLKTLAGIQKPLSGNIYIEGIAINHLYTEVLAKKLSIVLTESPQNSHLKVHELVSLGRHPYTGLLGQLKEKDIEQVNEAIHLTGINHLWKKSITELSDGERQKVMIARALAQDTPIILLDEPTAHLDLPNRVSIMQLLRTLVKRTRKTVILTTHDLDLALQSADRLGLLLENGYLKTGIPEDLVLAGTFEEAFKENGFYFDKKSGAFKIKPVLCGKINFKGTGLLAFWTKKALERNGYSIVNENQNMQIEVIEEKNEIILQNNNGKYFFYSIEELLNKLEELHL